MFSISVIVPAPGVGVDSSERRALFEGTPRMRVVTRATPIAGGIMSGADESDDDLVSGRVNRSNDQTTTWAENHYDTTNIGPIETGDFRVEFGGPAILVVEVARDTEEDGEFRPSAPLDAIVGTGWSADWAGQSGGTGVTGIGGDVGGRGMFAKGGD